MLMYVVVLSERGLMTCEYCFKMLRFVEKKDVNNKCKVESEYATKPAIYVQHNK